MTIDFTANVLFWKGPAPWYFLMVPEETSRKIKEVERLSTYGWGMIPVVARIGQSEFSTSLWPKDGCYLLPLKAVIRRSEGIAEGDRVTARISVVMTSSP